MYLMITTAFGDTIVIWATEITLEAGKKTLEIERKGSSEIGTFVDVARDFSACTRTYTKKNWANVPDDLVEKYKNVSNFLSEEKVEKKNILAYVSENSDRNTFICKKKLFISI